MNHDVAPGAAALPVDDLSRLVNPEVAPSAAALPVCFLPTDVAVLAARPAPRSLHLVRTFKVEGVSMDVHIDSCSPFCLVNAASLSPAQRAQVRPYTGPRLVGGNAGGMNVRGQYSGHLEINALKFRVPWLVVDNLPMQRILGWDFALRHLDNISPRSNTMMVLATPPADLSSWAIPSRAILPVQSTSPPALPCSPVLAPELLAVHALCVELRRLHQAALEVPVLAAALPSTLTTANVAALAQLNAVPSCWFRSQVLGRAGPGPGLLIQ